MYHQLSGHRSPSPSGEGVGVRENCSDKNLYSCIHPSKNPSIHFYPNGSFVFTSLCKPPPPGGGISDTFGRLRTASPGGEAYFMSLKPSNIAKRRPCHSPSPGGEGRGEGGLNCHSERKPAPTNLLLTRHLIPFALHPLCANH